MERLTKIRVIKLQDGYDLIFTDEMSGSSTGVTIPINGYKALAEHFKSGVMEISSDDIATLHKQSISNRRELLIGYSKFLGLAKYEHTQSLVNDDIDEYLANL